MHNTKQKNLEFKIAFCTTNLRYLLEDEDQTDPKTISNIAYMKSEIQKAEEQLEHIESSLQGDSGN